MDNDLDQLQANYLEQIELEDKIRELEDLIKEEENKKTTLINGKKNILEQIDAIKETKSTIIRYKNFINGATVNYLFLIGIFTPIAYGIISLIPSLVPFFPVVACGLTTLGITTFLSETKSKRKFLKLNNLKQLDSSIKVLLEQLNKNNGELIALGKNIRTTEAELKNTQDRYDNCLKDREELNIKIIQDRKSTFEETITEDNFEIKSPEDNKIDDDQPKVLIR